MDAVHNNPDKWEKSLTAAKDSHIILFSIILGQLEATIIKWYLNTYDIK